MPEWLGGPVRVIFQGSVSYFGWFWCAIQMFIVLATSRSQCCILWYSCIYSCTWAPYFFPSRMHSIKLPVFFHYQAKSMWKLRRKPISR
ncbi:uncharacterized protein BT62DRAFT_1081233 [Guyanagaster necrorhizus]|uniref:Uncharacterized protein n=1 Tax=Guyanagaster necrorhizus TaxID=856835 RepID=A0A9P7VG66_9AGAR|nr:uncharacterized protein BT62DRAFT_1081233 [Guyanagaster necrorhizus MCA 3950]KAG7439977.1 hypothetical protein BT62DRAFT_1081233 [Guyanagaster necrorhizus MCA 3950]